MKFSEQLRTIGCCTLLYLRAAGNMYCFHYDLDRSNDFATRRLAFFEGVFLFSLIYSPLILIQRHVADIGWYTYMAAVLLSVGVYGIFFREYFRVITKWQHDYCCWFPAFMLRNDFVKFSVWLSFFIVQLSVSLYLHYLYLEIST